MENLATVSTEKFIASMGYTDMPDSMEELAVLQKAYSKFVADDANDGSEEEVELGNKCAAAFTMQTGIDIEASLIMDYTLRATSPEIAAYMDMLLQRVMTSQFQVVWAAGYGEADSRIDSFREIIESDMYHFESEELVELLALVYAGDTWTYAAMGERVVFVKLEEQQ
jgi:hypothetical protein